MVTGIDETEGTATPTTTIQRDRTALRENIAASIEGALKGEGWRGITVKYVSHDLDALGCYTGSLRLSVPLNELTKFKEAIFVNDGAGTLKFGAVVVPGAIEIPLNSENIRAMLKDIGEAVTAQMESDLDRLASHRGYVHASAAMAL